jgi:hypothetical protein
VRDLLETLRLIEGLPSGNGVVQSLALLGLSEIYAEDLDFCEVFAELARIRDQGQRDRALHTAIRALEERIPAPRPAPRLRAEHHTN